MSSRLLCTKMTLLRMCSILVDLEITKSLLQVMIDTRTGQDSCL
jgi:hypothetical protein